MKPNRPILAGGALLCLALHASAAVHYVDVHSGSPAAPFTNWSSAALTIQEAVDEAVAGDEVLVTNGLYQTGGRTVQGVLTNRVAVTNALTVRSVNGPEVTVIRGYQMPGVTNGDDAVRCAYLANGASLIGFTLTNGATLSTNGYSGDSYGGGVACEWITSLVSNCVLTGNAAYYGGGGASYGTLVNCSLTGNSALDGGGAYASDLVNSVITRNSASDAGGGVESGNLTNCVLTRNSAGRYGGGTDGCNLNNCTLTGNLALIAGGGAYECTLKNCISYYNLAALGPNQSGGTADYCCTTPLPSDGTGNIEAEPLLASDSHLSVFSPCRGAGNPAFAIGTDIDGDPWAANPSIGCDEPIPGEITGPLQVSLQATYTNVAVGFAVELTATISGKVTASRWEFGDGIVLTNQTCFAHTWDAQGDYPVVLTAYNEINPGGVSATALVHVTSQPAHYVAWNSTGSAAPYSSWATAATNIQDAIDIAAPGSLILVSNGVYGAGGRIVSGMLSNRVAVTQPLVLQSLNGPASTVIQGYQVPGATNGDSAVRGVYLADGAALIGFTVTNGATRTNGDVYQEQLGGGIRCASVRSTVSNCVVAGNCAANCGGGACGGSFIDCIFSGNSALAGGGTYLCTLKHCLMTGNRAMFRDGYYQGGGGGAFATTLDDCTLAGNSAKLFGGAANASSLDHCFLADNSAWWGGGAYLSELNNSTLTRNSAAAGGGTHLGSLNHCTLTANSATGAGGGAYEGVVNNCIIYFNQANIDPNCSDATVNYCCTTPLPAGGQGNIDADPLLAGASHLTSGSPCRRAGNSGYTSGTDVDGEAWASPPSMGCDEFYGGACTGSLSVGIQASYTNVAAGFTVNLAALLDGRVTANRWELGDGTVVDNHPYVSHRWSQPGEYGVVLRTYNDSNPGGVSATVTVHVVSQPVHYVALLSQGPAAPYSSWATAATNIQDAVDAATVPGGLVVVSNGVYEIGGRGVSGGMSNRVAIDRPLLVRSLSGPEYTIIRGQPAPGTNSEDAPVRCVYLTNGATLAGFTLTNGWTVTNWPAGQEQDYYGGGVWCASGSAIVSNCILTGNLSLGGGQAAYAGTLFNCAITDNNGNGNGAAYMASLNNCTLTANTGGGASWSVLNNCIVYDNSSFDYDASVLNYCCTPFLPDSGRGNFTNAPLFLDPANHNARLQGGSPCINAGCNALALGAVDLDGRPRIAGGTVDVGAYEYQSPASLISYAWLQQYGLPVDGTADKADDDGDGMNNWQEWVAGTDPTNGASLLKLEPPVITPPGRLLRWSSDAGKNYWVERATNLEGPENFSEIQVYVAGLAGSTTYIDRDAAALPMAFYRVGMEGMDGNAPMIALAPTLVPGSVTLTWASVVTRSYTLERTTKPGASAVFSLVSSNIAGQAGTTSYTDTNAAAAAPCFYRIRVQQ